LTYLSGTVANILKLRRQKFDLSIDLYNGGSSPRISRFVNSRVRLGFDHTPKMRKASNLLATHPRIHKNWTREISEILRPLGIDPGSVRRGTSYYYSEEAKSYAREFLSLHCEERLVAINLGAGTPEKCWPVERFVGLAARIKDSYGFIPIGFYQSGDGKVDGAVL
jgi:ADP-heptose:LPS heptosyltransferase